MATKRKAIGTLITVPTLNDMPTPDRMMMTCTSTARTTTNQRVICFSSLERLIFSLLGSILWMTLTSTAMKNMKEGMPKAAMFRLEYPFTILSAPQWVGTWSGSLL